MLAVNYTSLRDNMKSYMDQVTDDYEMENIHVMGNKANYDWLMESKAQLENGNFASHTLIEVSEDE